MGGHLSWLGGYEFAFFIQLLPVVSVWVKRKYIYTSATLARAMQVANTSCPHSGLRPSSGGEVI